MIDKIKKVFLDNGYKMEIINGKEVFVKGNLYQRIDFVKDWNEYIIESAFSREEAEKNLFEDSDFISVNATDEEILEVMKECMD